MLSIINFSVGAQLISKQPSLRILSAHSAMMSREDSLASSVEVSIGLPLHLELDTCLSRVFFR